MAVTFGETETSVTLGRRLTDSLRERDTAAFIISTKGRTFTRHFGYDDVHFVLPVSDKAVYLTDTPMEALSLKVLYPGSAMLATDKLPARDTPHPHLEGKTETSLAQSRDKAVKEYARHLARHYLKFKRLLPPKCQS